MRSVEEVEAKLMQAKRRSATSAQKRNGVSDMDATSRAIVFNTFLHLFRTKTSAHIVVALI